MVKTQQKIRLSIQLITKYAKVKTITKKEPAIYKIDHECNSCLQNVSQILVQETVIGNQSRQKEDPQTAHQMKVVDWIVKHVGDPV